MSTLALVVPRGAYNNRQMNPQLPKAQIDILHRLIYATRARFSELLRLTDMESDSFKFQLRKLQTLGFIAKANDGLYELTPEGKAFASRLSKATGREIEQPKSSLLLLVTAKERGQTYVIGHLRTREPFNGFWGIASSPVLRGVPLLESARRALKKQTGLEADFAVRGMMHVIDTTPDGEVREDKLFALVHARLDARTPLGGWSGGVSAWMTPDELLAQSKLFPTTKIVLRAIDYPIDFYEASYAYDDDEY